MALLYIIYRHDFIMGRKLSSITLEQSSIQRMRYFRAALMGPVNSSIEQYYIRAILYIVHVPISSCP